MLGSIKNAKIMLDALEALFLRLDSKLGLLREEINNSDNSNILRFEPNEVAIELANKAREELLKEVELKRDNDIKEMKISCDFVVGQQNISVCCLVGRLYVSHDLLNRIQFVYLWPCLTTLALPPPPLKLVSSLSIRRSYISPDLILPYTAECVFYAHSVQPGSFEMEIRSFNSTNIHEEVNKNSQEYVVKHEKLNSPLRLELCQIDYHLNRIILFLENRNQQEYVLRIYDLASLHLINSVEINHSILRVLCYKDEYLSYYGGEEWSDEPLLKVYDSQMNRIRTTIALGEDIFRRFYAVDDFDARVIVVHGQRGLAVVDRARACLKRECSNLDSSTLLNETDRERDAQFLALPNRQAVEMHARFEYFNVRLCQADFIVATTWSKVFVFDCESLCLYTKCDIYSVCPQLHNWYLPNRMFVSKYGELVFYDSINLLLTFI